MCRRYAHFFFQTVVGKEWENGCVCLCVCVCVCGGGERERDSEGIKLYIHIGSVAAHASTTAA